VLCLYCKMEEKYQNKYRSSSFRLKGWDYGSHGLYFVTICTKDRIKYFGEIESRGPETQSIVSLRRTEIGEVAHENWKQIPTFHPYVELDDFVIMPDHIHGIIFINKPDKYPGRPTNSVFKAKISHQYYGAINRQSQHMQPQMKSDLHGNPFITIGLLEMKKNI
jgi:REP element-mobilizing transposase RayT